MLYTIKWPLLYAITHPLGGPLIFRWDFLMVRLHTYFPYIHIYFRSPLFRIQSIREIRKYEGFYSMAHGKTRAINAALGQI